MALRLERVPRVALERGRSIGAAAANVERPQHAPGSGPWRAAGLLGDPPLDRLDQQTHPLRPSIDQAL